MPRDSEKGSCYIFSRLSSNSGPLSYHLVIQLVNSLPPHYTKQEPFNEYVGFGVGNMSEFERGTREREWDRG